MLGYPARRGTRSALRRTKRSMRSSRTFVPYFAIRFRMGMSERLSHERLGRCSSRCGRRRLEHLVRCGREGGKLEITNSDAKQTSSQAEAPAKRNIPVRRSRAATFNWIRIQFGSSRFHRSPGAIRFGNAVRGRCRWVAGGNRPSNVRESGQVDRLGLSCVQNLCD